MSNRTVRVNELLQRELSLLLHTRFRTETVDITITSVDVTPDLRSAHVYYSVLGDEGRRASAARWLDSKAGFLRRELGKVVVLKYLPALNFEYDVALDRGDQVLRILDELDPS